MQSHFFRLGGWSVAVDVGCPATSDWIEENLAPWLRADDPVGPVHRVAFVPAEDPLRAAGVPPALPQRVERPCFALDTRMLEYPGWELAEDVVLEDGDYGSLLKIGRDRTQVIAPPGERPARVTLLRTVREVLTAPQRDADDRMELHAAGFAVGGRTVLVMGDKEAGKTTLLLHVLSTGAADLVTNDRTLVTRSPSGAPPTAAGVPTFAHVRPGTLAMFPQLAIQLGALDHPYAYSLRELDALPGREAEPRCDTRIVMTPAQLCRQVDATPHPGGPLAAIVLPQRPEGPDGSDGWEVERLDAEAGCAALMSNRYGLRTEPRRTTVYESLLGAVPRSEADDERLAWEIARRVPVVRCRMGVTTKADPENASRLLRALPL